MDVGAGDPLPGGTPYNAAFDRFPGQYDELRAAGHMARRRAEHFLQVVDSSPGPVLEVGCGTGTLLRALAAARPDREFLGVEPLANYVDYATGRAAEGGLTNVRFAAATGEELLSVTERGWAGLVISVDALHHVTDTDQVVRSVAAAARPGARWQAMEPNRVHPYVLAYHVLTAGERTFPYRDFVRRAAAGGWSLAGRTTMYLYPSGVARVPPWAERVERRLEHVLPLAGAVVLDLRRR